MADQMLLAWQDWLMAVTSREPVLLFLDDLQWSDEPTIRFIDAALHTLEDRPLMVLALARPEVDDAFASLWPTRPLDRLSLRPLSKRACTTIARRMLSDGGQDPALEVWIAQAIERSKGNPLYLEELLRSAATRQTDEPPDTVLAMVASRLRALPPSERRVLRAASVFGRAFWLGGLVALLDDPPAVIETIVGRLIDRELILPQRSSRFGGRAEYIFVRDLTREAAYATLPAQDCQRANKGAGLWLESAGESDPIILAGHYDRGQEPGRALPWLERAAEQALAASHLSAAIEHAERAIACGPDDLQRGALRLMQAEAHNWSRQSKNAHHACREAIESFAPGSPKWAHAAHQLAWACGDLGLVDELLVIAGELEEHASEGPDDVYLAAMAYCVAHLVRHGRRQEARPLEQIVHESSSDARSPSAAASIALLDFVTACSEDKPLEAVARCEQTIERFEEIGDQRNACIQRGNLATFLREYGQYERAIAAIQAAIAMGERLELTHCLSVHRANLATLLLRVGRQKEAKERLAIDIAAPESRHGAAQLYLAMAELELLGGSPRAALAAIDRVLARVSKSNFAAIYAHARAMQGKALLGLGEPERALEAATRGMERVQELTLMNEGESFIRLTYAEALLACGQSENARAAIDAARARLLARAEEITSSEQRAAFLERVAENRRTLELARAWSTGALS